MSAIRALMTIFEEELRERIFIPFREHVVRESELATELSQRRAPRDQSRQEKQPHVLEWLATERTLTLWPMFRMLDECRKGPDRLHRALASFCEDRAPGLLTLRGRGALNWWRNQVSHNNLSFSREKADSLYQDVAEAVGVLVSGSRPTTAPNVS